MVGERFSRRDAGANGRRAASGRFDPFATPSGSDRYLRRAVVHFAVSARREFPQSHLAIIRSATSNRVNSLQFIRLALALAGSLSLVARPIALPHTILDGLAMRAINAFLWPAPAAVENGVRRRIPGRERSRRARHRVLQGLQSLWRQFAPGFLDVLDDLARFDCRRLLGPSPRISGLPLPSAVPATSARAQTLTS